MGVFTLRKENCVQKQSVTEGRMAVWLSLQISYLNRTLTLGTLFLVTTLKVLASNNARKAKKNV